jgi:hypothetical protein
MTSNSDPIAVLTEALTRLPEIEAENIELREGLAEVRAMLQADDAGWSLISGLQSGERLEGLDLDEVHSIIKMLQPRVAAAGLTKRACDLHSGWVFGKGMSIDGVQDTKGPGAKSAAYRFYNNRINQESIFSPSAHEELQKSRFIEGTVVAACNTVKKTVQRIPFSQIVDVKLDPDYPTRILGYKRRWNPQTGPDSKTREVWLLTHRFEGKRPKSFGPENQKVPVDQDVTVVDLRANTLPGFVLGVPDGIAGLNWAETYTLALRGGVTVTEGLSRLIFKVTNKSKAGVQNAAVKIAGMTGAGNTASMTEGQDVEAIRTAGQAYQFDRLQPIAGLAAAAWNVSTPDLLNIGGSGASYATLSAISAGNRNAMTLMQREWTTFFQDIFEVMSLDRPAVHWEPLETPDPYRAAQSLTLLSPTLTDEEYRGKALDIQDISGNPRDVPPTLAARSQPAQTAATQASPGQGVANGTQSAGQGANDLRTDTISTQEALRREVANEDYLNRLESLVERLEAAKA